MGAAFTCGTRPSKPTTPRRIGALAYLTAAAFNTEPDRVRGQRLNGVTLTAMGLIIGGALIGSHEKVSGKYRTEPISQSKKPVEFALIACRSLFTK